MTEPEILRELTDDGVLVITMNRPETMNALNQRISRGIQEAALETKTNDAIKVIVLTGNGRGFCAGADLSSGGPARSGAGPVSRSIAANKLGGGAVVMALAESNVPVIGAINGAAAGAGFGLALCCDVRIASDQARMGSIFIRRGIATDYGVSWWLPRLVGASKAFELLYSGEIMPAEKLLSLGLVNRVVPHDTLMDETMAYARMIAAGPPLAYTYTRRNIMNSIDTGLRAQLETESIHQNEILKTQDASEGFRAFLEKRPASFTGS